MQRSVRCAEKGLSPGSNRKKARFWRGMVAQFPRLIDYMCADENLNQVRTYVMVNWSAHGMATL
jgi:hypothetical protein